MECLILVANLSEQLIHSVDYKETPHLF